jgi:hypothetical protein
VDLDEPHAKCVLTYVYTNIAIRFGWFLIPRNISRFQC